MIPVCDVDTAESAEIVREEIMAGRVANGPYVEKLEKAFAKFHNRAFGVTASSGTTALTLALRALELPKGSEVLMPNLTIISCAIACIENGLVPVPVEIDRECWMMDVEDMKRRITSRTKAVMPVHLFGWPHPRYGQIITEHDLFSIEDFSQAIGSVMSDGIKCGGFGTISVSSFYANKLITTGEGGICLTQDPGLAEKMRWYRNLCFGHGDERFLHDGIGQNWRMSNVAAAVGFPQVEKIPERVARKKQIAHRYRERLRGSAYTVLPEHDGCSWWMFPVLTPRWIDAREVIKEMAKFNIETRPFFTPLHEQPALRIWGRLPVSSEIARRGLYLPSGLALTEEQQDTVCAALNQILVEQAA